MKIFSSMHNPETTRYAIYYSVGLVAVIGTVVLTTLQFIQINAAQSTMTFFEGFFSLFMLSRNEEVGKAFLSHLSSILVLIKS